MCCLGTILKNTFGKKRTTQRNMIENDMNNSVNIKSLLSQYTIANTPTFNLQSKRCYARVIDVYDADTFTVAIPLFNTVYKFNVRLSGIDTPEIRSKNPKNKEFAVRARNRVLEWLGVIEPPLNTVYTTQQIKDFFTNKFILVWVQCYGFEKYGRLLADIYLHKDDIHSISDKLLLENLAYQYKGGKKLTEEEQEKMFTPQ
jgi:endonuclease YncB( thermonuclease family)